MRLLKSQRLRHRSLIQSLALELRRRQHSHIWKLTVKGRVNCQNALVQRRVCGLKIENRVEGRIDEIEMTGDFGVGRVQPSAFGKPADLFQCAGNSSRVAGELYRFGVREPFALATDGAFGQAHQSQTDGTERDEQGP